MSEQLLIMRLVWFRRGLRAFQAEVQAAMECGWSILEVQVSSGRLRHVVYALMIRNREEVQR